MLMLHTAYVEHRHSSPLLRLACTSLFTPTGWKNNKTSKKNKTMKRAKATVKKVKLEPLLLMLLLLERSGLVADTAVNVLS
jgi:hypothetical protein